jgi:hypothetical protein
MEAIHLSKNWTAKLVIKDPSDPHGWGKRTVDGFGTLYMWTLGHSTPLVIAQRVEDEVKPDKALKCICGSHHDRPFPAGQGRLLFDVAHDDRWEPCFPMGPEDTLDALARVAGKPGEKWPDDSPPIRH